MKLAIAEVSSGKVTFALGAWDVTAELRGSAQTLRIATDEGLEIDARALSFERVEARHGARRLEATRVSLDAKIRMVGGELQIEASRALFERLRYRDAAFELQAKSFELAEGATLTAGVFSTPLMVAHEIDVSSGSGAEELRIELEAATVSDLAFADILELTAFRLEGLRLARGPELLTFQRADVRAFVREQSKTFGAHTLQIDELGWKKGAQAFEARRVAARDAYVDLASMTVRCAAASCRGAKMSGEGLELGLEKLELPQGGQVAHPSGLSSIEARFEGFELNWIVAGEGAAATMLGRLLASELAESSASEGKEVELEDEALRELAARLAADGVELALGSWSLGAASASFQASQQISSRLFLAGREPRRFELQLGGGKLAEVALKPLASSI